MSSLPEDLKRIGRDRKEHLDRLAAMANSAHSAARGAAGAAIAHILAAGNALASARDLCGDGEWGAWVRSNFNGSLRTAQRYVRAARRFPRQVCDTTRVSHDSQTAALGALRRLLFGTAKQRSPDAIFLSTSAAAGEGEAPAPVIAAQVDGHAFPGLAIRRLHGLADELEPCAPEGDDGARAIISAIRSLADELQLDKSGAATAPASRLYFIEAVGGDRVKIGTASDPTARLAALQTGSPLSLRLLGAVPGGREFERALHARFSPFRLAGEWFHLSGSVREAISLLLRSDGLPEYDGRRSAT